MIVKRTKSNVTKIAGVFFKPGVNRIDNPKDVEALNANDVFNFEVEKGFLVVVSDGAVGEKGMSVADTVKYISEVESTKELAEILGKDKRPEVAKAVEARKIVITAERINRLKADEVKEFVLTVDSIDALTLAREDEERVTVQRAIDARLSELTE